MSQQHDPLFERDAQEKAHEGEDVTFTYSVVPEILFDGDWNTAHGELIEGEPPLMLRDTFTLYECLYADLPEDERPSQYEDEELA